LTQFSLPSGVADPFIMGRTRPKTRKAPQPSETPREPTVEALLEKAQELIVQCDYDLAGRFVERLLQRAPDSAEAKEMLGVVQLETGLLDKAKQVSFKTSLRSVFDDFVLSDFLIIAATTSRRTIPTTACRASVSCTAERQRSTNGVDAFRGSRRHFDAPAQRQGTCGRYCFDEK
jgi:hypothetical protein